jgi:formylglycine-generating enzyme required for sulfatase activity
VQSGNHRIRITHDGFQDWESDVVCDGKPQQIAVKLDQGSGSIPRPMETMPVLQQSHPNVSQLSQPAMQQSYAVTPINSQPVMQNTAPQQNWQTGGGQGNYVQSETGKKSAAKPLIFAVIGIGGLLILISGGLFGAYKLGMFGGSDRGNVNTVNINSSNPPTNSNTNSQTTPAVKTEMVKIPGGKFTMGYNGGTAFERPENETEVKDFWIDKTEVTNAEYYEFVKAKNYNPIPLNWENGKPLTSEVNMPVRYVNIDDIKAFTAWRSERDKTTYRLPTEEEFEYAARNGEENDIYPWGDQWEDGKANVKRDLTLAPVGASTGSANKWGVLDLVGNVWEWTESKAVAYKGNTPEVVKRMEAQFGNGFLVVRGAFDPNGQLSTATSYYRVFKKESQRDKVVGFRLARSD